jgi:hypothetical protein
METKLSSLGELKTLTEKEFDDCMWWKKELIKDNGPEAIRNFLIFKDKLVPCMPSLNFDHGIDPQNLSRFIEKFIDEYKQC